MGAGWFVKLKKTKTGWLMHRFKHILKSKVTTKVLPQILRKSKFVKKLTQGPLL